MFDSVCQLASTFLKLNAAGCVLFRKWSAEFYCDQNRLVHSVIDFGLNKQSGDNQEYVLRGRSSETSDVLEEVKHVRDFLEACLNEWNHMIDVQRDQFYFLNHFTTEQLVILCQDLAEFCQKRECPPRIFQLLHAVKPDCTRQQLADATKEAFRDLGAKDTPPELEDDVMRSDDETSDDVSSAQRLADIGRFLEEVQGAGFSLEHAKKALEAVGDPTLADDGINQIFTSQH